MHETSKTVIIPETADSTPGGFKAKLAYGTGTLTEMILNVGMKQYGNSVYTIIFGVNPALVGLALAIPRLWDAVVDPLVGAWSDNLKSKWGRRKPLMLAGSILAGFTFFAAFMAPDSWSETAKFYYFVFVCIAFFTFATMFCIPFIAMGYEFSDDYDERSRVMAFRPFFGPLGMLVVMWLFPLAQLRIFGDVTIGVKVVALGVCLIIISTAFVPILFVPKRNRMVRNQKESMPFFKAFKTTITNRAFLFTLVPCVVVGMSLNYRAQFFMYVNIYYVFDGNIQLGSSYSALFFTISAVIVMSCSPFLAKFATWRGKKTAMMILLTVILFGSISTYWLMTPAAPWLGLISHIIIEIAIAGIFMLYQAMVADVCDLDEWNTGERREASYGAVTGLIFKAGSSVAILLAGVGLWLGGFDASLGENQSPEFIQGARFQFALVPAVAAAVGLILYRNYPITKEVAQEISIKLKQRHRSEHGK